MWKFWGDTFVWGRNREGSLSLSLIAEWHELLPDMTGPTPAFEVDEVLKLNTLDLSLDFQSGGEAAARQEVADHYRCWGKELNGDNAINFSSVIYVHNSQIILQVYLSDEELEELVKSLQAFASLSGPKHFSGRFSHRILVGPLLLGLGVQTDEKGDFLAGRLPGAIMDVPAMSFVSGRSVPARSDERSLFAAILDQF